MLTVPGQQNSFSTHERVFLWKCQSFWDRKCLDLRGTRTHNLRIHAECSNLLRYQGQTFALPCFEHWRWRFRYFLSKVNIWYILTVHGQQHSLPINYSWNSFSIKLDVCFVLADIGNFLTVDFLPVTVIYLCNVYIQLNFSNFVRH